MAPTYDVDALKARTEENARDAYHFSQRQLDRVVDPSTRENAYAAVSEFAHERPLLSAFLLAQILFSFLPLVIFATFSLSTVAFALGAALVFALFWIGVALLVLVPALFITSSVGLLVWIWAAGSFVVAKKLWSVAPASIKGGDEKHQGQGQKQDGAVIAHDGVFNGEQKPGVVIKEEEQ